jgi:hypothetical protein
MTPVPPRLGPPGHPGPMPGEGAPGPPSIVSTPGRVDADPDVDGVALAAATATGVLLGSRFAAVAAWVAATCCLAVVCLWAGGAARTRGGPAGGAVVGVLVLGLLLASGAAAASVRAAAVRRGPLVGWLRQPARVEVAGVVAEEPRRLRYGGHWVVLTVDRVDRGGRTYRTRERAGLIVPRGGDGRFAVGDRLRLRAAVGAARWSDALGRRPPVVLRHPVIQERAPPAGAALRISESVRNAARSRALATLPAERAGLLVGMALGDTSLLPAELEGDFRAAGLTHLMAVSGANLAVVLAAGLWLAGLGGAGRRVLASSGSCWWSCWSSSPAGSPACSGPVSWPAWSCSGSRPGAARAAAVPSAWPWWCCCWPTLGSPAPSGSSSRWPRPPGCSGSARPWPGRCRTGSPSASAGPPA